MTTSFAPVADSLTEEPCNKNKNWNDFSGYHPKYWCFKSLSKEPKDKMNSSVYQIFDVSRLPDENFLPKTLAASLILRSGTVSKPATAVTYFLFCL